VSNPTQRHSSLLTRTLALALALVGLALPVLGSAAAIPAQLRAAILLRALRYEAGFARGRDAVNLVVIGRQSSSSDAQAMTQNFTQLGNSDAAGRPVRVTMALVAADTDAAARVTATHAKIVYVAAGSESMLGRLSGLPSGTIVLCADGASVGSGCVLGVEQAGQQSRLVVDLGRATSAGLTFDARMLRLARVVR